MVGSDSPIRGIVGSRAANALKDVFEIETVGALLEHYPRRLEDRGKLTDFRHLRLDEHVTVLAKTKQVDTKTYQPKGGGRLAARTEVVITDGERDLLCTFFRQAWRANQLVPGTVALFSGKVSVFNRRRQLTHPTCEVIGHGTELDSFEDAVQDASTRRWLPIYPASAKLTSKMIMDSVELVLTAVDPLPDPLPEDVRRRHGFASYDEAIRTLHRPDSREAWGAARRRLAYDEAFVLQTVLAQRRMFTRSLQAMPRRRRPGGLLDRFDAALPFQLTRGQREIGEQVGNDLEQPHPMHRLLQGEVGSGKTLVALRAMLQVVDAGGQAALLAPTEVLAQQHHRSIVGMLGSMAEGGMLGGDDDATRVALVTGSLSAKRRKGALLDAVSGSAGIVIGTHALLEQAVQFSDLGLVVVDEQHRFGVEQRAALTDKSGITPPHVLVMTATPIPRTVAMTVFGDLDVSTLRELPLGRAEISSTVVPSSERPDWLARAWQRVHEEVDKGHQVYVVCPRIGGEPESAMQEPVEDDPDERTGTRRPPLAVADVAAMLVEGPLADLRVFMLHGRLPAEEKDDLMRRFAAGDIDVLVATTVIEVGVDVPNASLMLVLDADRFGVSQLHQLRGRVGRGSVPGLCLLVTDALEGSRSRARLEGVAATTDGFELSRLDLEHRREGDVLGATQSGRRSSLRLLSVLRDEDVIADARSAADALVQADPALAGHPELRRRVEALMQTEQADFLEKS
ncbi:MAG TPA: ATP-dependent DNA helicase RecG [Nocardioidaceae bacterium]